MDSAQLAATIIGSGGGGAVVLAAVKGAIKRMDGSALREKQRNADLKTQRDDMYQRLLDAQYAADAESRRRRRAQEHAAELRALLLQSGMALQELPPWPSADDTEYPERIPHS